MFFNVIAGAKHWIQIEHWFTPGSEVFGFWVTRSHTQMSQSIKWNWKLAKIRDRIRTYIEIEWDGTHIVTRTQRKLIKTMWNYAPNKLLLVTHRVVSLFICHRHVFFFFIHRSSSSCCHLQFYLISSIDRIHRPLRKFHLKRCNKITNLIFFCFFFKRIEHKTRYGVQTHLSMSISTVIYSNRFVSVCLKRSTFYRKFV